MKLKDWLEGIIGGGCFTLSCLWQIGALVAPIVGLIFLFSLFRNC